MKRLLLTITILPLFLCCCYDAGTLVGIGYRATIPKKPYCGILAAYPIVPPNPLYNVPSCYQCAVNGCGQRICGYDCKIAGGLVKCATFPDQRCIVGTAGYIACGYDCRRSSHEVRCGVRFGDTCVETLSGRIICGLNCRVKAGFVVCDRTLPFRPEFAEERI